VIRNESTDAVWAKEKAYVLVECKNRKGKADKNDALSLIDKLSTRAGRCSLGFFVATSGFTTSFHDKVREERTKGALVVPVGPAELAQLVASNERSVALKALHQRAAMR